MNFIKYILFISLFSVFGALIAQESSLVPKDVNVKIIKLKAELSEAKLGNNNFQISKVYIDLANFYRNLGLDSEALKNYHSAQDIHIYKDSTFVYINNEIASIHHNLKQYDDALHYLKQSLITSEEIQFKKGLARTNALLGSVSEKQGNYNHALEYQNESLRIFKTLKDSTGLALTNENIGSIYEDLEQFDLAYSYFKKAYSYESNHISDRKINIINNLGDVNSKKGNLNKGLQYTKEALRLARKAINNKQEVKALNDLARTHSELGNYEEAYHYLNIKNELSDQELKRQNTELVSAMQVLYHVKESEIELALLAKQNQINKTRQYVILLSSVAMFLAFMFWFIYLKKRKKQEAKILNYKQKLLQSDLDVKIAEETSLKREIDIKIAALTNYSLNIAHKNKVLADVSRTLTNLKSRNGEFVKSKLQDLVKEIDFDLANEDEWTELMNFFAQINPDFFENLKFQVTETLSASELRLCMLLRLNLSSKEIAAILCITPDSVRIARYRLRKKIPIASKADLQAYLLNL